MHCMSDGTDMTQSDAAMSQVISQGRAMPTLSVSLSISIMYVSHSRNTSSHYRVQPTSFGSNPDSPWEPFNKLDTG